MKTREKHARNRSWRTGLGGVILLALVASGCSTVTGAAIGAGSGAAIGAGVGAAAGTLYGVSH